MAKKKTKLELTWIGKDEHPRLEPRILLNDSERSHHSSKRVTDSDIFDNLLVHGDNLLALKALEQEYAGKIKCAFIDPPYNTGSAFEQYEDGIEHSIWLSLMRDRIALLHSLLAEDGSLWITIDDNEAHYLKVVCDEVFGRFNFVSNVVWQKKYTVANDAKWLSDSHDHVLIYARNKEIWRPYRLPRTEAMNARYRNPDNHPKGPWKATPLYAKRKGSKKEQAFTFRFKNGVVWSAPAGTSPRFPDHKLRELDEGDEIWFGADGKANPARKTFLAELKIEGPPAPTVWLHSDVGNNHEAREEAKRANPEAPFATPKPERLLKRILDLATQPGDIVLDSFAGSGTTGAVAHKMRRRWIMVELGDHCMTHIAPRLQRIADGEDDVGITEEVAWDGGGGFRFARLAPSLLRRDKWGNWIISDQYNGEMLAEAMCKLEGFTYAPNSTSYWQQGQSTERDYIYVTTQTLTHAQLQVLSAEVGPDRTLLVCCSAFRADPDEFENLTITKIPAAVLSRCEWGRDDYSLNVESILSEGLPLEADEDTAEETKKTTRAKRKPPAVQEMTLFGEEES
ncbi:MAG: site-specific DNA-methyltransferase [Planctomycetota bacterium]